MERSDVGVADERFRIAPENLRIEEGQQSHRPVSPCSTSDRFHLRVEPDAHQIFGANFVFALLVPPELVDLFVENHLVSGFFERSHAAAQQVWAWIVRGSDDADRIALGERSRAKELVLGSFRRDRYRGNYGEGAWLRRRQGTRS